MLAQTSALDCTVLCNTSRILLIPKYSHLQVPSGFTDRVSLSAGSTFGGMRTLRLCPHAFCTSSSVSPGVAHAGTWNSKTFCSCCVRKIVQVMLFTPFSSGNLKTNLSPGSACLGTCKEYA